MDALLMWLDQVTRLGSVTETDSKLSIELPDEVLDRPGMAAMLTQKDLLFPPEVFLQVTPPERPAPLLASDVELPEGLVPCHQHELAYQDLIQRQTEGRQIPPRSRLTLIRDMASCTDCSLCLTLKVVIDKERHWKQVRGTWPQDVDSKIWFYPAKVVENTLPGHYLTWNSRPLVLGARGATLVQSDYVTCVDLSTADFIHQAVTAAVNLAPRVETLKKVLRDRPLAGPAAGRILPPEYWANQDVLTAERFPGPLPLPSLFFMSLLGQICHRVTRETDDIHLFQVDGARPMEVRCRLIQSGVELDGREHQITPATAGQLLHFYREAVQGKPQGQNLDLLQQAVRMAGDAMLSKLVTDILPIEAYYDFQWKALAKTRFKEQVDLIKSYLGAVQTARGKVSAAMDELYKNLTGVVTGAAAVAAVLLTAAVTKNTQIYDYLIISSVLIACPYIPIHVLRAVSLVSAAEQDLKQFQMDMELSAKELGLPLQILNIDAQVKPSFGQVRERVRITGKWLGVITLLSVVTAVVSFCLGQSSVKALIPAWAALPLILVSGAIPIGMLVSFWKRHGTG